MQGYIVLENGDYFTGTLCTELNNPVYGEAVFFTGMTGYQEVVTDPSFHGQMVVFTYPLIGQYGWNAGDNESKSLQPQALIINTLEEEGDHYASETSLCSIAEANDVPVLTDVDTRSLVKVLRDNGDMQAVITTEPPKECSLEDQAPLAELMLIPDVSVQKKIKMNNDGPHIVLWDFGTKESIGNALVELGCAVTIMPWNSTFEEIQAEKPDGVVLSNGPGNPKQMQHLLSDIKQVAESYPVMGICLGHQLLALAHGAETEKLRFGHRGANQPVIDKETNCVYITSQNHSYVVKEESLNGTGFSVKFHNINDGSVEGLVHNARAVFTAQFHPEAHPGPTDSNGLFQQFLTVVAEGKEAALHA
ncbi:carbamoyl-phosphate synthase small subunit [Salsuginibacillus halophilus]|uniref:Carbamoyl phosphate synthase small chain n=1 Tax=Salsuginibacillus halophilus TaxID=517424 RepID=A0A2P8HXJ4_9BACI|nr:carbamoyl phosphate synthase small subunit [Salsuginibacillus halophilus]PSL50938.1 carbamoyl-phosphate synthase small subunit [Salsuginibacillus halophilus]